MRGESVVNRSESFLEIGLHPDRQFVFADLTRRQLQKSKGGVDLGGARPTQECIENRGMETVRDWD